MFIKQRVINCIKEVKQINIKNRTYYFFNDNLVKNRQKIIFAIGIYNIGYITIKKIADCENIYNENPLYLLINHANGYIDEKNENT